MRKALKMVLRSRYDVVEWDDDLAFEKCRSGTRLRLAVNFRAWGGQMEYSYSWPSEKASQFSMSLESLMGVGDPVQVWDEINFDQTPLMAEEFSLVDSVFQACIE